MQGKAQENTLMGGTKTQTYRLLPNLECLPTYNLGHVHLKYFSVNSNVKLFFPSTSWRIKLTEKLTEK